MIHIFFLIAMWTHESSPPSFGRTIILDAIFVCGRDGDLEKGIHVRMKNVILLF